ncbi:MAG: CinA family protein [Oscillospiraceae bacterium]|nr:CinA family protein [Oscillospiraceae bacterium]
MTMSLCSDVLQTLSGKTLVTSESLTGGGIGAALTAIPGSSSVYKGGVICYTNWVKENILGVPGDVLEKYGAVSEPTAKAMAEGVRKLLKADIAVSVTGLAGPGGDEFGNPVGTVCIGYADLRQSFAGTYHFEGEREAVRTQTIEQALRLVLKNNQS